VSGVSFGETILPFAALHPFEGSLDRQQFFARGIQSVQNIFNGIFWLHGQKS
jgi:hypothetical protein